jgi:hypothetical protein
VGENLQDHSITSINFGIADGQISGDIMRDPNVRSARPIPESSSSCGEFRLPAQRITSFFALISCGPVGENLQDHSITSINFGIADGQISGDIMRDPNVVPGCRGSGEDLHGRYPRARAVVGSLGCLRRGSLLGDVIATGVQIKTQDGPHEIKAKKEVILCAGSLNSPQLLELSRRFGRAATSGE